MVRGRWGILLKILYIYIKYLVMFSKRLYLTDENQRPVAVQVDIHDFEKMEQIIEDYALGKFIEENNPDNNLSLNEATSYYKRLDKK